MSKQKSLTFRCRYCKDHKQFHRSPEKLADHLHGFHRDEVARDAGVEDHVPLPSPAVFEEVTEILGRSVKTVQFDQTWIKLMPKDVYEQVHALAQRRDFDEILALARRGQLESEVAASALEGPLEPSGGGGGVWWGVRFGGESYRARNGGRTENEIRQRAGIKAVSRSHSRRPVQARR